MKHSKTMILAGLVTVSLLLASRLLITPSHAHRPVLEGQGGAPTVSVPGTSSSLEQPRRTPLENLEAEPDSAAGFYDAAKGSVVEGPFWFTTQAGSAKGDGAPARLVELRVEGRMNLAVEDRQAGELVYRMRLNELVATGKDDQGRAISGTDPSLIRELARPVQVRLRDDGALLGLRFEEGVGARSRNWLRGLLHAFRITIPDATADEWTLEEFENVGRLTVDYEVERRVDSMFTLTRSKSDVRPSAAGVIVEDYEGAGFARANVELGWCDRIEVREGGRLDVESANMVLQMQLRGLLELESNGTFEPLPVDWEGVWLDPVYDAAIGQAEMESSRLRRWREDVANMNLTELIEAIEAGLLADPIDDELLMNMQTALIKLLTVEPRQLDDLKGLLLAAGITETAAAYIINAAGAIPTQAAQSFLAEIAQSKSAPPETRLASLRVMSLIESPTALVVDTIRQGMMNYDEDPRLRRRSLSAAGALSAKSSQDPGANPETLLDDLLAMESSVEASGDLEPWIKALGNTGSDRILDVLRRYASHQNANVRKAVAYALRSLNQLAATELLIALTSDSEWRVRARAVHHLAPRAADSAMQRVAVVLSSDPHDGVRRAALIGWAERSNETVIRAAIQRASSEDASDSLRSLARHILES